MMSRCLSNELTEKNYYDSEMSRKYWSVSLWKNFKDCQAKSIAVLNKEWAEEDDSTALLVGNYVHSYFESEQEHDKFKADHPEMISSRGATKGQLKKEFQQAEQMINRLKEDEMFTYFYKGVKEEIVTGEIKGISFKGKIDCLNAEQGYFVDIKTLNKFDKVWNAELRQWENFIVNRKYHVQMAVYQELLYQKYGKNFIPIVYVVTKDKIPMTRGFEINANYLVEGFCEVEDTIEYFEQVKKGLVSPERCKCCDYCNSTHKNDHFLTMEELDKLSGITYG